MKSKVVLGGLAFGALLLYAGSSNNITQEPKRTEAIYKFEELDVDYEYGNPPYEEVQGYFGEYECTDDCSGHEAGYAWAEEKYITSTDDCGGNSNSFIEGCMQYVTDNY